MMKNTETLSPESLALLGEYSCDCEQVKRHTKPVQFGDIDATLELDLFEDEYSSLFN
jgi:hypothetical protein